MPTDPSIAVDRPNQSRPIFVQARDLADLLSAGPPLLVDAEELARLLSVSVAHLSRMRSAGRIGPRPIRLGSRVLWRRASVEAWLAESERTGQLLTDEQFDAASDNGRFA